jgi:hypothetical protein
MKLVPTIAALALTALCFAQGQPVVIHNCDDLAGVSVGWSTNLPDTKLEVVTDPAQVAEGKGSLHLVAVSPANPKANSYVSVILKAPPSDLTGKQIAFEAWTATPDKSLALYVRGSDAQGRCVVSWNSWGGLLRAGRRTFTLVPGLSLGGFAWEPDMVKSEDHTAVVSWEIITGTHDAGVTYDLCVDNLRLEPNTMKSFADTKAAHPLYPDTTLAQDGQARVVIVAPPDPDWSRTAQDLAAAIEQAGGARPAVRDGNQVTNADLAASNAILLGNVANNRAMLYAYSHYQTFADGVFPGPGGYELRTAQDPWGKGTNLIIVGASDLAGLQAGVQALHAGLKPGPTLTLPRLSEVKLGGAAATRWGSLFTQPLDEAWVQSQQRAAEQALETGGHTGLFSQIAGVGTQYALTGREPYAKVFVWLVKRAYQHYQTKPDTYGGPWGMDSDFPSQEVIPAWDAVEECPALTAEERLEVSRILFQYITDAALPEASGAAAEAAGGRLVSNHGTFAALGTYLAGEFFAKYYDSAEAKQWLEFGDTTFTNLAQGAKVHEDCNGYQWLTQLHVMRYALSKPDLTYFANGNARQAADLAILTMDNLGYQVPYGDTGEWTCWFSELPVLRACEWYYRDGRYQWAINRKVALTGRVAYGEYDPQAPEREPADLIGARAWPLDAKYHADSGQGVPPLAKSVDKVAFRQSFDAQGQYLLLDGLNNGGHRHMDGNSLPQWTERDRVWLADADYIKSLPKYHNGVLILKDGQSATIPGLCELESFADLPNFAGSVTTLRDYAGVDWRRHVLWLKGQAFIVADQMVAKETGDFSFRAVWQTVGEARVKDNGLDIDQHGQHARFAMTGDTRCLLNDDPVTGANWSSYPHADKPIVRVFQGVCNRRLQAGQRFTLFTVLHASGAQASPVRVARLDDNRAVVTGLKEPLLVSLPGPDGAVALPQGMAVEATAMVLSPETAYVLGLQRAPALGANLPAGGADAEYDIATGTAYLKAPAGVTAAAAQQASHQQLGTVGVTARELSDLLQALALRAPAATAAGRAPEALPQLRQLWSYRDRLAAYALTNNAQVFEAVDAGLKLTCDPQALPRNVFGDTPTNTLDNLVDGQLLTTDGGVMWDTDQTVTLNLEFDNVHDVSRLDLKAWFATSSSKDKLYQLGKLKVLASNDGFQQDTRTLVDFADEQAHGNWGEPGHEPQLYSFADLKAQARSLRLILTPRPGTGLYLAELTVWGTRPGLELAGSAGPAQGRPVHTFTCVKCADLSGDKQEEVLAGSSNGSLYCFGAKGDLLWKYDGGAPVECVSVVDFPGDGKPTVVVGVHDARAIALDTAGKELWTFKPPYYKRAGHPRTIFPADLAGQGKQVAIIGAENWHYYAVDAAGKMIWQYESVHGSTAGAAADLDGDKRDEIVAGTEYYWWHVINPDGTRRFEYNSQGGPCANAVATGDLNGDGKREVLFGGADTLIHVLSGDGNLLWTFNTGDEVTALQCADVNGDGKDEVLAASLSFNLYCLDGSGQPLWRQDLGNQVRALAAYRSGELWQVAAGGDSGQVVVLRGADGKPVASLPAPAQVLALTVASLAGDGTADLVATTADGNVTALALP